MHQCCCKNAVLTSSDDLFFLGFDGADDSAEQPA
jgi:hypothetical protein